MWDVFEHIKDGRALLAEIRRRLAPGGVLFMQTPSFRALAARIMHEKCNLFDGIEHVNIYCPRTMARVAENNSYTIASMETVISEIPILQNFG